MANNDGSIVRKDICREGGLDKKIQWTCEGCKWEVVGSLPLFTEDEIKRSVWGIWGNIT